MLTVFKAPAFAASVFLAAPVALPAPADAQGIGHTYLMRGSVVDVSPGVVTVCIGRADGAQAGQTLSVMRVTSVGGPGKLLSFHRQAVGSLKISRIVDDHFAQATVVSGKIAKNDIVELRRNKHFEKELV